MLRTALLTLLVLAGALAGCRRDASDVVTITFWGMGREGEVVRTFVPAFEAENPGIRVRVQQIPWTAAHEKLLTAFVGRATPDLAQLGNTWVPEFVALGALEDLAPRVAASAAVDERDYFPGIWATNVVDGTLYGVPWYVDTRLLFYRKSALAEAGFAEPPRTWAEWREAMQRIRARAAPNGYAILLPTNEWTQPVILGMQAGSPLLRDDGRYGAFRGEAFREAFDFYVGLFRDRLAPPIANTQVANLYDDFARGGFAMYITGPWNLGEFARRLPPEFQDDWATAPLPAPDTASGYPGVSTAGGASLVLFRRARHPEAAWRFVEFLSRPEQQVAFYAGTGSLPARESAWELGELTADPRAEAFRVQLRHVRPTPLVPEWEQVAARVMARAEAAARGAMTEEAALAALDADVDRILAKRRWLLDREAARKEASAAGGTFPPAASPVRRAARP
jgi:multiple sugar transport system substrate-binding protein